MQERFAIKLIDLDKLGLPNYDVVGKEDRFCELWRIYLLKPRSALSDVQNVATGISGKTTVKHEQVIESPVYSLSSPTPPKIPFASMSLLQKRILQSDLRKDPFSALELSLAW